MVDRKRVLKFILITAMLLGAIALGVVFSQLRRQQDQPNTLPDIAARALMTIARVHQTATKDGKVQWEMDAESAQLEAESGQMILTSPQVLFFMDDGGRARLTADQGVLDTRTNDMEVRGHVHLKDDRYTLETETVIYRHDRRTLQTDVPVTISSGSARLRADRMIYHLDSNQAQFDGGVEGTLNEDLAK